VPQGVGDLGPHEGEVGEVAFHRGLQSLAGRGSRTRGRRGAGFAGARGTRPVGSAGERRRRRRRRRRGRGSPGVPAWRSWRQARPSGAGARVACPTLRWGPVEQREDAGEVAATATASAVGVCRQPVTVAASRAGGDRPQWTGDVRSPCRRRRARWRQAVDLRQRGA
jgi:hypothetical protein